MEYVHHGKTECSNEDKFSSVCTNECDSGFQLVGSRVRYVFDHFFLNRAKFMSSVINLNLI